MYEHPDIVESFIRERHQQLLREAAEYRLLRAARSGRRRARGVGWSLTAPLAALARIVRARASASRSGLEVRHPTADRPEPAQRPATAGAARP